MKIIAPLRTKVKSPFPPNNRQAAGPVRIYGAEKGTPNADQITLLRTSLFYNLARTVHSGAGFFVFSWGGAKASRYSGKPLPRTTTISISELDLR